MKALLAALLAVATGGGGLGDPSEIRVQAPPAALESRPRAGQRSTASEENAPRARGKTPNAAKPGVSAKDSAAMRRRARKAIESGDYQRAARLVRQADRVRKASERRAWLLIEAEVRHARKQYAGAALAAMRLVILHPRSERVGVALYWAGRAYEGLKRLEKAIELYEECLAGKSTPASVRKRAKARLAAARKKVLR